MISGKTNIARHVVKAILALTAALTIALAAMPVEQAQAYTDKLWKKDVNDKYLNQYSGECMPCTTYASKVVNKKHYGYNLKAGTVSAQKSQLENAVKAGLAKRIVSWTTKVNYSKIKPGDIILYRCGSLPTHIAIVGGNGEKLHHGGIGSSGSVVYKYTVSEFSHYGFMRYGSFNSPYIVYRLLGKNTRKVRVKTKITKAAKRLAKKAGIKLNMSGAVFKLYKGKKLVATFKTTSSGISSTKKIATGTYTIKQVKAPKYMNLHKSFKVKIGRNKKGEIRIIPMYAAVDKSELKAIIKKNEEAKAAKEAEEANSSDTSTESTSTDSSSSNESNDAA